MAETPANNWHVITGGPSAGKTSLVTALAKRGYATIPEAARLIIDEDLSAGRTIEQIRANEKKFQERILLRKAKVEANIGDQTLRFFDRGMHDTAAYLRYYAYPIEKWAAEIIRHATYKCVFVLEPLPSFTKDYSRTEDAAFTAALTDLLCEAYQENGLKVVRVPSMNLEGRVEFVLKRVK
jgi:predicted ATPase